MAVAVACSVAALTSLLPLWSVCSSSSRMAPGGSPPLGLGMPLGDVPVAARGARLPLLMLLCPTHPGPSRGTRCGLLSSTWGRVAPWSRDRVTE